MPGGLSSRRRLRLETLEPRKLLASDAVFRGQVFYDLNRDQLPGATEQGLPGWLVYLDIDQNGSRSSQEPAVLSDSAGNYEIRGDYSGVFVVRIEPRSGWRTTTPLQASYRVGVTVGQVREDLDFGQVIEDPALLATLGGVVWNDADRDAAFDADETRLQGWQIFLDQNDNGRIDIGENWVFSQFDGSYQFPGLPPLTYSVRQVTPTGWNVTYPASATHQVSLIEGQQSLGNDFGAVLDGGGSVQGRKWTDANSNGRFDLDEVGQAGITLFLDDNLNGVWDEHEPATETDANGFYSFVGVAPGEHIIAERIPAFWRQNWPGTQKGFEPGALELIPVLMPGGEGGFYVGDWWGDFRQAVARFDAERGQLSVAANSGAGHLASATRIDLGGKVDFLLPADIDLDHDLDVITIANGIDTDRRVPVAMIETWRNQGSGQFQSLAQLQVEGVVDQATLLDAHGDSGTDLLLMQRSSALTLEAAPLLLAGQSDGSFRIEDLAIFRNLDRGSLIVSDLNRDEFPDLVTLNTLQNEILVRFNLGGGLFSSGVSYGVGFRPGFISAGDLDGDGDLDLLVSNEFSNDLSILRNLGGGRFDAEQRRGPVGMPRASALIDLDADQDLDIAVISGLGNSIVTFLNNGKGDFVAGNQVTLPAPPGDLVMGDWDRDGDVDLAAAMRGLGQIAILANSGAGTLTLGDRISLPPRFEQLSTGYVNSDDWLDLLVSHTGNDGGPLLSALIGRGDRTFAAPVAIPTELPVAVESADFFPGQGGNDLLSHSEYSDTLSLWRNDGQGIFQQERRIQLNGHPESVTVADFNRDGLSDLLVKLFGNDSIDVYLNSGTGTFSPGASLAIEHPISEVLVGDLDEDQIADLLLSSAVDQIVSILRGRGDGTFESEHALNVNSSGSMALGDLDGDGHVDLIMSLLDDSLGLVRNRVAPAQRHRTDVSENGTSAGHDFGNQRLRWTNPVDPLDVDANGLLAPLDALLVINYINRFGSGRIPESLALRAPYYDAAGGDDIAPLDALVIINALNYLVRPGGEGESAGGLESDSAAAFEAFAAQNERSFAGGLLTTSVTRSMTRDDSSLRSPSRIPQDLATGVGVFPVAAVLSSARPGTAGDAGIQAIQALEDLITELAIDLDRLRRQPAGRYSIGIR
jgi:hypothetical protein